MPIYEVRALYIHAQPEQKLNWGELVAWWESGAEQWDGLKEIVQCMAHPAQPSEPKAEPCEAGAMCLMCPDRDANADYQRGFSDGLAELPEPLSADNLAWIDEQVAKAEPAGRTNSGDETHTCRVLVESWRN